MRRLTTTRRGPGPLHRPRARTTPPLALAMFGGAAALACHTTSKSADPSGETQTSASSGDAGPGRSDESAYAPTVQAATPEHPFLPSQDLPTHRNDAPSPGKNPIDLGRLTLPEGFSIEIYSKDVPNARTLRRGGPGIVYVGNRQEDKVYALVDKDGDHRPEAVHVVASDMDMPNGLAYREGTLYIAEMGRITRLDDIDDHLEDPPKPVLVTDELPTKEHHGWRYIDFGPDGKLYVAVGAPCNLCEREEPLFSSIATLDVTQPGAEPTKFDIFARGIRNSVGFAWHPDTHELWFTENGRDELGDELPPDELNRAPSAGLDFGYPGCHAGVIADPKFGGPDACQGTQVPVQNLGAHVAALGMEFTAGHGLPAPHEQSVLIAEHGSWNRENKLGYRITELQLDGDRATSYRPFIEGWVDAKNDRVFGRPVDLEFLDDGSFLVSDDWQGAVYRVVPPGASPAGGTGPTTASKTSTRAP